MASVELGILGPVEVRRNGSPLPLGGPKQRALLAMLLLETSRAVSRDRLIAGLWGESPPPSASASLDTYVSRLRRVVGADRLLRRPPGYVLLVDPGELDATRFRDLVELARAERDPGARAELLVGALALWRGPALDDVLFVPFASEAAGELEARRLEAIEDRIDAELARGAGAALIAELGPLVREHPLSERLVGQQMLALYRAGRQAEALAALQSARHRLSRELGIAPGPQLAELERRILVHDRSLGDDTDRDATLPPAPAGPRHRRRRPLAVAALAAAAALVLAVVITVADDGDGDGDTSVAARPGADAAIEVDATTGERTRAVELPSAPAAAVAVAGSVWIAAPGDGQVLRLDPASGTVADRIDVPGSPGALAVGGGAVWVASTVGGAIRRIDPTTGRVTQTVPVGGANAVAIAAERGRLWVADASGHGLVEVDARSGTVQATHHLDVRPAAVAAVDGDLWIAAYDEGTIAQVDPATGRTTQTVRVGNGPSALLAAAGALWVANALDSTVSRIDPATGAVTATVIVGSGPAALAATGSDVWVGSQYSGTITRIGTETNRVGRPVAVGGEPTALADLAGHLWVGASASQATHRGGTLRIVSTQRFTTADPALSYTAEPLQFSRLVHDGLVTFQAAPGPAGLRLVPDLAVALPAPADGGTTYTFRLRHGIRYSDGRPVRAGDFRRGIERLFRVGSFGADYFSGIAGAARCGRQPEHCTLRDGITTDDRRGTVSFRLAAPDPDFLFKLTIFAYAAPVPPVPPGTPDRDTGRTPVPGTGPYRIASLTNRELRFERNPRFREWSHAAQPDGNPDAIVWRYARSTDAAAAAVQAGEADWLFGLVAPSRLPALRRSSPGQLHVNQSLIFDFIPLNTHVAPFDDVRVRRAVNLAIDRNRIGRLYGGRDVAQPLCQALLPGIRGYRRACPYPHDLERAKALVAASGTRGKRVDVWASTDQVGTPRAVPAYVTAVLRSLGFRARLHMAPLARYTPAFRRRIQLSVDGDWVADYPAPSAYLPQFFGCHGGLSNGYVCDRRLERLMRRASALQLTDGAAADATWARADRRITNQALWIPTVNVHGPELVSRRLRNY